MTTMVDVGKARVLAQSVLDADGAHRGGHTVALAHAVMALTTPIPADLETIRTLAAACPWKGPWKAGRFEIDCPCPNGESCGCSHTCDEVTAPDEYPSEQCVVQIAVPGLERFAAPLADYIAVLDPQTVLGLVARVAAAEREAERWRHGGQIEGDYICPDTLAMYEAHAELRRLTTEADALAAWGHRTAEHDDFVRREYESASNNEDALYVENERLSHEVDRVTRETDALVATLSRLRAGGWTVAVHNDYRLNGVPHTFWLFTRGNVAIKGEGLTDIDALKEVAGRAEAIDVGGKL